MNFDQTDRPSFPVVRRGYDRVHVDEYLDSLEVGVGALRSRVEELEAELEDARQREETPPEVPASQAGYAAVSAHVARVMQVLDEEVERLRAHANEEVERMLSEARADAHRIQQDAESKANEVRCLADDALHEAREQAGRVNSDLEHRRRSLYGKLRRTRNAIDEALSDLDPEIDEGRRANEVVPLLEDERSEEGVEE
jgi:cell division septum initiation protein DivIVA